MSRGTIKITLIQYIINFKMLRLLEIVSITTATLTLIKLTLKI